MIGLQPSLFDGGPPRPDPAFTGLRRIELDAGAWVDHCPGWLAGADAAFEALVGAARWQQREVPMYDRRVLEPRLTAGWSVDAAAADVPEVLRSICAVLSDRYRVGFDRVWVNLYRDGRDSVAWHGDRNRLVMTDPLVATVSLGATRRFLLRPRGTTRIGHELRPAAGDLVVMGGSCQSSYEHTVPKTAAAVGPRMSVTVRHSVPGPGQRWLREPSSEESGHAW